MGNPVVHFEIMGSDSDQLAKFYSELFGWQIQVLPDMNSYGIVETQAGSGINGGVGVTEDGSSYTTFYIAVPDTDEALQKIEAAGGRTLQPTVVMEGIVTFAHFSDPAGNRVGLVKDEGAPPESEVKGNPAVGWFEVLGPDPDALASFYTSLFGWSTKRNQMGEDYVYHEVDTQAGGAGTNGGIGGAVDGLPHCTIYAGVKDVTETLGRAESLGGAIVMPEMAVTEHTIIGQFTDPQGNVFGLYKDTM